MDHSRQEASRVSVTLGQSTTMKLQSLIDGNPKIWWPSCSVELNHFRNFGRETFLWNYYEIEPSAWQMPFEDFFLFSALAAKLICGVELEPFAWEANCSAMLFKNFSHFKSGSHLIYWSRTILAILVHGYNRLTVLGFNNTLTLVGHFVSSPREREKRNRRDSRGDEREG